MNVRFKYASVASETGPLLAQYLTERGLKLGNLGPTICYGMPHAGDKVLNGLVGGGDKIRRLVQMNQGGVRTVPWFQGTTIPEGFKFPALARMKSGHGGEDIVPVFEPKEIPWRVQAGFAWFSSYVPTKTEYRVWTFRGECLDVYEKVMVRNGEYKYIGRNYRNGFDFRLKTDYPAGIVYQAKKCLEALSFDFGAIDILYGEDNQAYVLECNTAPGVIKSGAQGTLAKLADKMVEWVKSDCPERGY